MAVRVTTAAAARKILGRGLAAKLDLGPRDLRLPDLPGPASLAAETERHVQRGAIRVLLPALPLGSKVLGIMNQRHLGHLPKAARFAYLEAMKADGAQWDASDTVWLWDWRLGRPGNRGVCWIEFKRPRKPKPVSVGQVQWAEDMRALGFVAGWAQADWQAEDLLIRAGAPLARLMLRPAWATPPVEGP